MYAAKGRIIRCSARTKLVWETDGDFRFRFRLNYATVNRIINFRYTYISMSLNEALIIAYVKVSIATYMYVCPRYGPILKCQIYVVHVLLLCASSDIYPNLSKHDARLCVCVFIQNNFWMKYTVSDDVGREREIYREWECLFQVRAAVF
jgi:hypothetical protein